MCSDYLFSCTFSPFYASLYPTNNYNAVALLSHQIFCLLNLLAFLFHGIQRLTDDGYGKAYRSFGRKIDFFWALRYEANRYFHKNWVSLFLTVSGHPPDG
jgi:hypothetical protein